jgi:hypothetical protein
VLQLLDRAGTDLAPQPGTPRGQQAGVRARSGQIALPARAAVPLVRLTEAPALLRALELDVPRKAAVAFAQARLRVTWDGRAQPSIDAPAALFYGTGTLYNRDGREYLVRGFPVHVRDDGRRVHLACYFPMPFFRSARVELVGPEATAIPEVRWGVRYVPYRDPPNHVAYFHATYADHPRPELGKDLVLLDTRQVEGSAEWSGHLVGMSFIFSHRAVLSTLEGDPRFFFDDSLTPQAQGTGTEEWGGGGDYWGGQTMTLPLAGHPVGAPNAQAAKAEEDKIESAYRFLLADLMPFGRNARICLEHGGTNESTEHYETVTYWYGTPRAALRQTDVFQVGDAASEQVHRYESPDASASYMISSRYEWGGRSRPRPGGIPDAHRPGAVHPGDVGVHGTAGARELRGAAAAEARLRLPQPACGSVRGRRQPGAEGGGLGLAAGGGVVPGGLEHVCVFQPAGGIGCHAARGADLQPPLPRRRVSGPPRADRGAVGDPRPAPVHAGPAAALSRPSDPGTGME